MSGFTHKIGITFANDAGTITSTTDSYSVDSEVNLDEAVPASSTNKEYDFSITVANIKTLCIYCDQAVTLKFDSTSSPTPQLALVAKKQIIWTIDHLEANPLTANVTKVYVTNPALVAANLKIRCGETVGV